MQRVTQFVSAFFGKHIFPFQEVETLNEGNNKNSLPNSTDWRNWKLFVLISLESSHFSEYWIVNVSEKRLLNKDIGCMARGTEISGVNIAWRFCRNEKKKKKINKQKKMKKQNRAFKLTVSSSSTFITSWEILSQLMNLFFKPIEFFIGNEARR